MFDLIGKVIGTVVGVVGGVSYTVLAVAFSVPVTIIEKAVESGCITKEEIEKFCDDIKRNI